jgi:hypothetical protein
MGLDPERYVVGDDGLLVEKVGPWAKDKQEILGDYIQISGATRRKYRKNRPLSLTFSAARARIGDQRFHALQSAIPRRFNSSRATVM